MNYFEIIFEKVDNSNNSSLDDEKKITVIMTKFTIKKY